MVDEGFFLVGRHRCQECNAMIVGDPQPESGYAMQCFCGGKTVVESLAQMPLAEGFRPSKELTRGWKELG